MTEERISGAVSKGRIYLSGVVSKGGTLSEGEIERNRSIFRYAAVHFARQGYRTVNPTANLRIKNNSEGSRDVWERIMRLVLRDLLACDHICLLPGWSESPGARIEAGLALDVGIEFLAPPDVVDPHKYLAPAVARRLAEQKPSDDTGEALAGADVSGAHSPVEPPPAPSRLQGDPAAHEQALSGRIPLPFSSEFGARLPRTGYDDDAGWDLFVELRSHEHDGKTHVTNELERDEQGRFITVPPHGFLDIPCGLRMELPPGVWAMVVGRSSTIRRRGLHVPIGVLDTGYRGPLFSGVWNLTSSPVRIRDGERLAQVILFENITARYTPTRVDRVADSERGSNGFGSSGS